MVKQNKEKVENTLTNNEKWLLHKKSDNCLLQYNSNIIYNK